MTAAVVGAVVIVGHWRRNRGSNDFTEWPYMVLAMPPHDYVNFLASSSVRYQLLHEVANQPQKPGTLADRCSCSRPTVHRALTRLQTYKWVRAAEDGYELTPVGKRVLQQYDALCETLSTVMQYPEFFNHIGEWGLDIPLKAIDASTVVTATPEKPHAPLTHFTTRLQEISSEQCYVMAPVISSEFAAAGQPLLDAGTDLELVLSEAVLAPSDTEYPTELMTALETDQITLYMSPEDFLFGLTLLDERVFVGTHDENGQFSACLESTDSTLYAWAMNLYAEYRAAAQQIEDVSDLP